MKNQRVGKVSPSQDSLIECGLRCFVSPSKRLSFVEGALFTYHESSKNPFCAPKLFIQTNFDQQGWVDSIVAALAFPSAFTALRHAARAHIMANYDLHEKCLPMQSHLIESVL